MHAQLNCGTTRGRTPSITPIIQLKLTQYALVDSEGPDFCVGISKAACCKYRSISELVR